MPMRVRHYFRTLEATVNSSSRHWYQANVASARQRALGTLRQGLHDGQLLSMQHNVSPAQFLEM